MSLFKYSFFGGIANDGWSNSLFRDEPGVTLLSEPLRARALLRKWAKLLSTGCAWDYIRHSRDDIRGDGMLTELETLTQDYKGPASTPIEQPGSVVLVQFSNADRTKKKALYLHGVPDAKIASKTLAAYPAFDSLFDAWAAEIKLYKWGWKTVKDKIRSPIQTVTALASGKVRIVTVDPVFSAPFDGIHKQLFVADVTSVPRMRNPVVVIPESANTCVTRNKFLLPVSDGGSVVRNTYEFVIPANVEMVRPTLHKVGRRFRPQAGGRRLLRIY